MITDERLGEALGALTDGVRPEPHPYERVVRRYRRTRRRRTAAIVTGLAAVVAAAVFSVVTPGERAQPTGPVDDRWAARLEWMERMRTSPTRGDAGKDAAFVEALRERIAQRQQAGEYWDMPDPVSEVNVPFVADIGSQRIAFVVFHLQRPDAVTEWPDKMAWFTAARGAGVETLAAPYLEQRVGHGFDPYQERQFDEATVALVPDGCVFETAPLPAADDWTAEPTGSYIVRDADSVRPEWWRVVCDGTVEEIRAAPAPFEYEVSPGEVDAALTRARGTVDRSLIADAIKYDTWQWHVNAPLFAVWGGQAAGTGEFLGNTYDGRVVVTAAPAVRGGWLGTVRVAHDRVPSSGATTNELPFGTGDDPGDPDGVLAVPLSESGSILVVTPEAAVAARAVVDGRVVATTAVRDAGAILHAKRELTMVVEALDAAGNVLARSGLADIESRGGDESNWD